MNADQDALEEARVILPDHTGHDDRRDGATVCSTTLGWATSPFFLMALFGKYT